MSNPVQAVVPDWTLECDEKSTMVSLKRTTNRGSWLSLYGNTTTYFVRGNAVNQLLLLPDGMNLSGSTSKVRAFTSNSKLTFSIRIDSMLPSILPSSKYIVKNTHHGAPEALPVATN
jgi:hypothetical protein